METYDMSVVIPTFNRSYLLERLLESLQKDRAGFQYGKSEVIVVDSSAGEEKSKIMAACDRYDARYIEGPESVRKKRNMGIRAAQYPYIVFEDSDVVVKEGLLNHHAETYLNGKDNPRLGGSFGLTVFTGEDNFVWKVIQYTTLTDSFSFAEKWPYQDWTIGNNVSFKKSVLEDVHLFEENFPFRLGADDLDLSYRITNKGYLIQSQPKAVTYHAKDTWKKWKLVRERSVRWGRMEYYMSLRHPQIFINCIPQNTFVALVLLLIFALFSAVSRSAVPALMYAVWCLLTFVATYVTDVKESDGKNLLYYVFGKYLEVRYYWGHVWEGLKNKSLSGIYKKMSFSAGQTKMILGKEAKRLTMLIANLVFVTLLMLLYM